MVTRSTLPSPLTDSEDEYDLIDRSVSPNNGPSEALEPKTSVSEEGLDPNGKDTNEMITRIREVVHERREKRRQKESDTAALVEHAYTALRTAVVASIIFYFVYHPFTTAVLRSLIKSPEASTSFRTVTLPVSYGELGFSLRGVWVSSVVDGGLADQHSDLRIGDKIVAVNDANVEASTHSELNKHIQDAYLSGTVKLLVRYDKQWAESTRDLLQMEHAAAARDAKEKGLNDEIFRLSIHVATLKQIATSHERERENFKKQLAERDASIALCTKLYNEKLVELSRSYVEVDKLKNSIEEMKMEREETSLVRHISMKGENRDFKVKIAASHKEWRAPGRTSTGRRLTISEIWVSAVSYGGVAQLSGLRMSDKIITMNDVNVDGMPVEELFKILRSKTLKMAVKHYHSAKEAMAKLVDDRDNDKYVFNTDI